MGNRDSKGRFAAKETTVSKATGLPSGTRLNSVPSGATGLKQTHGYVQEEYLRELAGPRGTMIYREMRDNDPIIGAMFFGLEMFMRRTRWFVDAATEDPKGESDAQFIRECKDDMSNTWSDFVAEICSVFQYGWQWNEILYKIRDGVQEEIPDSPSGSKYKDGKIGWRKFDTRAQSSLDRWDFDDQGGLRGLYQRPAPTYEELYVPITKSLLFRTTSHMNNPEGRSILRNAYRPWYFKKRIEEIEGVGVERDLAGLPFAEVPAEMMSADASEADKATLASIVELVKNVRRDEQEGVVWPQSYDENGNSMYKFSLMSSGGSRQFSTDAIITRYDSRIAMVILSDFILLGNDSSAGSFAMATSKTGLFQSALSTWLDMIQDVLNDYAIPRLFKLNSMDGPFPRFRHEEVQQPSLADMATFVAALAGAGAQLFPDIELENHFRQMGQLPLREAKDADKTKEDNLRHQNIDAAIAGATEAIKNPGGPPPAPVVMGKQPGSVPGAPTKTTGKVKSKLPPQSRRATASVNAANNVQVTKRRVVRRRR